MKYTRTVTHLMPSPYKTRCFDYNQIGCKSRSDCINKCHVEWTLEHCNSLPNYFILDKHNDKNVLNESCYELHYCEKKYKSPDCTNEYYAIKLMADKKLKELANGQMVKLLITH